MSSKALQIRDAVIALLKASAVAGVAASSIYTDWAFAIKVQDLPAIAVELGDEQAAQRVLIGALDRSMMLKVSVMSSGTDATTVADSVIVEAHRRIVADLTLGGLAMDVTQQSIVRRRDVLEAPVLITDLNYQVDYRTTNLSLET